MKIKCPYCFDSFNPYQTLFRCRNTASCSGLEPDKTYSGYRNIYPENMGHVFAQPTGVMQRILGQFRVRTHADCDLCGEETPRRICPNCHQELSFDAGCLPELTIAIIGPRASGKSNYIAVLIHELRNRVLQNFDNAFLQTIGDTTAKRYHDGFGSFVFGDSPRAVPATQSAVVNPDLRIPMIYRLTFGKGRGAKAVNLVLFDTAGEDLNNLDILGSEARYISTADGLIYLIDPTQIDAVRQTVGNEQLLGQRLAKADPIDIINRLYELYEQTKQIDLNKPIKKPFAFAVSKIDIIEVMLPPGNALHRNSEHFNAVNMDDIESVHSDLEVLIDSWGLNAEISPRFENYRYFGFSAFGGPPNNDPDKTLSYVEPKRVEDPLLWILSELKVVKKG